MDVETYQFAEVNGARLRYDDQGQGSPLVLIHSALGHLGSWDPQMPAFAEKYRVIRYDIRGWGQSTGPEGDYYDSDDLRALLDRLGIQRAALLGCSYGGGIAIDFALAFPQRVDELVLVGPALGGHPNQPDEITDRLQKAIQQAYQDGDKDLAAELTAQVWVDGPGRSASQVDPEFRRKALEMIRFTYGLPDRQDAREMEPPAIERLQEITIPTLVIMGEEDTPSMQLVTRLIEQHVPGARGVVLPGTAHLPNLELPELFNRTVLDFLQR